MDWLRKWSPMNSNWQEQWVQFDCAGKTIRLQGVPALAPPILEISAAQLWKCHQGNDLWTIVIARSLIALFSCIRTRRSISPFEVTLAKLT